ncbi:MAG: YggS family pyridoxal phosphate-dependent enzyme [Bacilli bacterium]|nr:YggS family pyridoxal phosphate-dependent enzyme [Bacilli bacterium]
MILRKDIDSFIKTINKNITLIAATKYVDPLIMEQLLTKGINNFGENRVDDFLTKYESLKSHKEIVWHFIGHLQRNKAKKVVNKIDFLHSLDSLELAKILNDNLDKPLNCFVEVSINNEETKNGVKVDDLNNFMTKLQGFSNIKVVGLMMMAVKNSQENFLEEQFKKIEQLKERISKELNIELPYLSIGMSDDYLIAIKHNATHIRLGRILYEN